MIEQDQAFVSTFQFFNFIHSMSANFHQTFADGHQKQTDKQID